MSNDQIDKLLADLDKRWSRNISTAMYNASKKAERDGHKCVTIDREAFRAALRELAKQETP